MNEMNSPTLPWLSNLSKAQNLTQLWVSLQALMEEWKEPEIMHTFKNSLTVNGTHLEVIHKRTQYMYLYL